MKSNNDMPAMPSTTWDNKVDEVIEQTSGLTKLEHFAGLAMQGFCSKSSAPDSLSTVNKVAAVSVEMAKALLSQLEDKGDE